MIISFVVIMVLVTAALFTPITGRGSTIPVQKILTTLAPHFNGTVPVIRLTPYMRGLYRQQKFTVAYHFQEGNMGDPIGMTLKLFPQKKSNIHIYVYAKDPGPVLNAKKALTGDNQFDSEFMVYSNEPDEVVRYFHDEKRRAAVRRLKEQGWQLNYIKGDIIKAASVKITPALSLSDIEDALNQLLALKI